MHANMSDLWTFSSASHTPNIHQNTRPDCPAIISSPPPLSSPSSFNNHGNQPHTKVTSNHLPKLQEASPELPHSQDTSPHLPSPQITSSHHFTHPPVTSPHLHPPQVTSSHHSQVISPHLHNSQVTPLHLPHSQDNSPHLPSPQITSPHYTHPQVCSPNLHAPQMTPTDFSHSMLASPHLTHPQVASTHLSHSHVASPHLSHPHLTSSNLPHPQVTSPDIHNSQVASTHLHNSQVTSPHLSHSQITSPHLHNSQVTSPQPQTNSPHLSSPQYTNTHFFHQTQEASPHYLTQCQISSSYQTTHPQVTSPHPHQSQVTFPYLHHSQTTSPHPHVTSPNFVPQAQLTSPNLVPQPHLSPSPQNAFSNHHHNPALNYPNWNRSEPSPELSCLLNTNSYSYPVKLAPILFQQKSEPDPRQHYNHFHSDLKQGRTTAQLDLPLHNQNRISAGVTCQRDIEFENTHTLSCNAHTLIDSGVYVQGDTPGPGQDIWEPLETTLSELQSSQLGSMYGGATTGRWDSVEFISSSTEDFSTTQFFPDSYHDNNAPQSFCSPTTPGPSPHYPQTPTISSPGPQMHSSKDRLGFPTQTSIVLSTNKSTGCCPQESDSYPVSSDPGQHQPHKTSRRLILVKDEPAQNQRCFSPQDVSSAAQSQGHFAGLTWKEENGGRGRRRGGGGGRNNQLDWVLMKQSKHANSTEAPGYRLQCTVCKRDFRSLPALNGHMRSHSGIRAATWLKKDEDASSPAEPLVSMVIPVSVPVQPRGVSKACRSGQRRCSRLAPTTGGPVLYRSLMHLNREDGVTKANKAEACSDDDEDDEAVISGNEVTDGGRGHYTPPPLLCPNRTGPGLYCSLSTKRHQRVQTVQHHNTQNGLTRTTAVETLTTGINKPRINVGRGFQAQIPPLWDHKHAHSESHNALLLWTPWDELQCPINQERVEAVLMMARSSVMPGGGVSPEYALHILSESKGDFLLTVEKLLSTPEASDNHTGWSAAEKRLLVKSLQQHHKDFNSIQRKVQTKSLSQCVEFYYLWKKKLSLTVKNPAGLTITLPNTNGQSLSKSHDAS